MADALRRTGAVLTTGGLGPTRDDMTKKVVAELLGAPLEFDETIWQPTASSGSPRLGRDAGGEQPRARPRCPRGATVLPNRWGTAPGLWLEGPPGLVIMLPGVPSEMRKLLEHEVVPRLAARAGGAVVRSRVVRTTGHPESRPWPSGWATSSATIAPLTLAYLPGLDGVDLRLTAWSLPPAEADAPARARRRDAAARAGRRARLRRGRRPTWRRSCWSAPAHAGLIAGRGGIVHRRTASARG